LGCNPLGAKGGCGLTLCSPWTAGFAKTAHM
jgi:hypothetical protein